jgi:hypothetical protein
MPLLLPQGCSNEDAIPAYLHVTYGALFPLLYQSGPGKNVAVLVIPLHMPIPLQSRVEESMPMEEGEDSKDGLF